MGFWIIQVCIFISFNSELFFKKVIYGLSEIFFFGFFKLGSCSKNPNNYPFFCLIMLHLIVNCKNHHSEVCHLSKKIIKWVFLSKFDPIILTFEPFSVSSQNRQNESSFNENLNSKSGRSGESRIRHWFQKSNGFSLGLPLRVVQTQAILFLKSMSERDRSDIERLWIWMQSSSIDFESF